MIKHPYDLNKFQFRQCIEEMLGTTDLENLHTQPEGVPDHTVQTGKDDGTPWHLKFYDNFANSRFSIVYAAFLQQFVQRLFGEAIVVQAKPTFRIHWKGNLSVGAFHRDSDYNHPSEEVNFWIPVTEAYGTNTIWLESATDKGDFHPERVSYGEALMFRGGDLCHGNHLNDTDITRVSFDLRAIPISKWVEPTEVKSGVAHGKKFIIGDYYKLIEPQPA